MIESSSFLLQSVARVNIGSDEARIKTVKGTPGVKKAIKYPEDKLTCQAGDFGLQRLLLFHNLVVADGEAISCVL